MAELHENLSMIAGKIKMSDWDHEAMQDSVEYRHGMYFALCTVLFFQCVNWIIKSQGPPKQLRQGISEWKWRNLYVSWIHAFFCAVWTLSSLLSYPDIWANLLTHINLFTYFNVSFALGYFFYDFVDLLINNKALEMWEVMLHHVAVAGMFYYNIYLKANIGFNLVALCVEVNSFFLHWRKLLQMVGTPYSSTRYIIIKYFNIISFAIFRFGPLIAITTVIFYWRLRVSPLYYACIIIAMIFMDVLNIILFKRLFKSDLLRSNDGKPSTLCQTVQLDFKMVFSKTSEKERVIMVNNNVSEMTDSKKSE